MTSPETATQEGLDTPNKSSRYDVSRSDLPVHCPLPGTSLWDSHPQVYIPVENTGSGKCPYCGAVYHLID